MATSPNPFDKFDSQVSGGNPFDQFDQKKADTSTPAPAAPKTSLVQNAFGAIAEPAMQMASGMVAKPLSDIAGLAATGKEMIDPTPGGGDPEGFKNYVQNKLTYQPRTPAGQAVAKYNPMALAGDAVGWVGQKAGELAGSQGRNPSFGRGVAEGVTQIPNLLGAKAGEATKAAVPGAQAAMDIAKGENLPKDTIRTNAQASGLTTPIEGTSWLASLPGLNKVDKWISATNEPKINRLVADNFGIPKGTAITVDELNMVRSRAGNAYRAVAAAGDEMKQPVEAPSGFYHPNGSPLTTTKMTSGFKSDPEFNTSMVKMAHEISALQSELPATFKASDASLKIIGDYLNKDSFTPSTTLRAIRQLRKDANTEFKSDDPEKLASAFTRKEIADKLEDMIERNLQRTGQTDLLTQYKAARATIAQTYDVEAALDNTGNVNARKLYAISQKKPGVFTGNLKAIADYAGAFPEGAQKVSNAKQALTPWDWMIGAGSLASGHPALILGDVGLRFGIPKLAEKGLMQKKTPKYKATQGIGAALPPVGLGVSEQAQQQPPGVEARADGGPVVPGKPYLVGENGPELIVPHAGGTVLPNDQTMAAMSQNALDKLRYQNANNMQVQQQIAPFEHQAFYREEAQQHPLAAPLYPVVEAAYQGAKATGIMKALGQTDNTTTPASIDQIIRSWQGTREGLMNYLKTLTN